MVISNAKYDRKHSGITNRRFQTGLDDSTNLGIDTSSFEIPRYEELKYLTVDLADE